jgi:hypothetical protein
MLSSDDVIRRDWNVLDLRVAYVPEASCNSVLELSTRKHRRIYLLLHLITINVLTFWYFHIKILVHNKP